MKHILAYIHGFGSSGNSSKGQALRARFESIDVPFMCPELNHPSFATQTCTDNLAYLDALDTEMQAKHGDFRWRLVGSSMGGYLSSRWAQLRPERVDRLLLLCPAFDFAKRWPTILGDRAIEQWQADGSFPFPGPAGKTERLHWLFFEDGCSHPAHPEFQCDAAIIHGHRDTVVPIESSRQYVADHPKIELIEVDDDHPLSGSLETIWTKAQDFLVE